MQRSARTAHTIRPSRSGSSTMQPATGHAAWQIEHANAPKQRSGSITAIVFGAFFRGPDIILVHIALGLYPISADLPGLHEAFAEPGHELAIVVGQVLKKAVNRLNDQAPLGEPGHRAEGVEPGLHFDGHADAELRVVLHLLPGSRTG